MDWLIKWLLTWVLQGLGDFFSAIYLVGAAVFDDSVMKSMLSFWQSIGYIIFSVSVLFAFFSLYEKSINGEQPNFYNFAKNLTVSAFIVYSTPLIKHVFVESLEILKLMLKAIDNNFTQPQINLGIGDGVGTLLMCVLVIVVCIGGFTTFFGSLRRAGAISIYAMTIYWYIPEVMMGNYSGIVGWLKQVLGLILTHIFQVAFFTVGIVRAQNMLTVGDLNASITAMIFFMSLPMIPQVMNALFQTPTGNKGGALGMAMSAAHMGFSAMHHHGGAKQST
jgi:hypothetical protein